MTPDCPFYLTVIPTNRLKDSSNVWFYNKPMGVNYLASLMSMAAKESGIDTTRKTNHSVRKTCTRTLRRNHVAPHKAIKIMGHKNPLTLLQYDGELSDDQHQEYCRYLTSSSHMSTETVRSTDGKRGPARGPASRTCCRHTLAADPFMTVLTATYGLMKIEVIDVKVFVLLK